MEAVRGGDALSEGESAWRGGDPLIAWRGAATTFAERGVMVGAAEEEEGCCGESAGEWERREEEWEGEEGDCKGELL